jgi:Kdo2-lipid IVA lauroyltransferase/acyltransferase
MALKKDFKYLEHSFYLLAIKCCSFLFRNSTRKGMYRWAGALGALLYAVDGKHREAAISGLTQAFNGSKSKKEVKALTAQCFTAMAKSGGEMVFYLGKPDQVRESVRIEGVEHLREGLAKGKGVVLVSAHFGNFVLMLARLCLEGYRMHVIMRPLKDKRIEDIFMPEARRLGLNPIYSLPRPACVQQALKALRKNETVFIPVDQNFGTGGVYVDFFNRKAATAPGAVVFAERTGAAIVPCFIIRNPDDSHTIRFEPAIEPERAGEREECVRVTLQRITALIERYIREYPQEWTWIHRRWKSRPKPA